MSPLPLFLASLLLGCGPDAPGPQAPSSAPSAATWGEAAARPPAAPPEPATPGAPSPVRLTLTVDDPPAVGAVTVAGVRAAQLAGDWIEAGSQPAFWWSRPAGPIEPSMTLDVPLADGLHYFAVISVDGDDLPDRGDFIGGPVPHLAAGAALDIAIDRRFGFHIAAPPAADAAPPPPSAPTSQAVELSLDGVKAPTGPVSVLVLGHVPPRDRPESEEAPPSYVFRSERRALSFPATLELPLPAGLEVRIVLDVDGDGRAGAADLASEPQPAFSPPTGGGAAPFVIVGPFTEPSAAFQDPPSADEEWPSDRKPGLGYPLRISTGVTMEFVKSGRVVVSGYTASEEPLSGPPAFHWASETLSLDWPLELNAPLPVGLDVVVALDLNGSGTADGGDLATSPLRAWTPPEGTSELILSEVLPVDAP